MHCVFAVVAGGRFERKLRLVSQPADPAPFAAKVICAISDLQRN
jgi:hypothetical protein